MLDIELQSEAGEYRQRAINNRYGQDRDVMVLRANGTEPTQPLASRMSNGNEAGPAKVPIDAKRRLRPPPLVKRPLGRPRASH